MLSVGTRRGGSCGVMFQPQIGGNIQSQLLIFTEEEKTFARFVHWKRFNEKLNKRKYRNWNTSNVCDVLVFIIKLFLFHAKSLFVSSQNNIIFSLLKLPLHPHTDG